MKVKSLKSARKPNPYARKILVQFKVNSEEMREILKRAHYWCKGNISEIARYAILNFPLTEPKKEGKK